MTVARDALLQPFLGGATVPEPVALAMPQSIFRFCCRAAAGLPAIEASVASNRSSSVRGPEPQGVWVWPETLRLSRGKRAPTRALRSDYRARPESAPRDDDLDDDGTTARPFYSLPFWHPSTPCNRSSRGQRPPCTPCNAGGRTRSRSRPSAGRTPHTGPTGGARRRPVDARRRWRRRPPSPGSRDEQPSKPIATDRPVAEEPGRPTRARRHPLLPAKRRPASGGAGPAARRTARRPPNSG